MSKVPELFGSMVFNDSVMRERLPKDIYRALRRTINEGTALDPAVADVVAQGTDTLILTQEGGLYLWNISWVYDVGWDLKQVTTGVMVPKQLQREPKPPEEPGNRPLDQKGIFDAEYFVDPAGDLYSFADGTAKQVTTPGKVVLLR